MSGNIIIRKAKSNYVCDCCGYIIKQGTEYLDKVILNNGKCVQHSRYHDECPKLFPQEILLSKIIRADGDLIATDKQGAKIHIIGIAYKGTSDPVILYMDWDSTTKKTMNWALVVDYYDEHGNPII